MMARMITLSLTESPISVGPGQPPRGNDTKIEERAHELLRRLRERSLRAGRWRQRKGRAA